MSLTVDNYRFVLVVGTELGYSILKVRQTQSGRLQAIWKLSACFDFGYSKSCLNLSSSSHLNLSTSLNSSYELDSKEIVDLFSQSFYLNCHLYFFLTMNRFHLLTFSIINRSCSLSFFCYITDHKCSLRPIIGLHTLKNQGRKNKCACFGPVSNWSEKY